MLLLGFDLLLLCYNETFLHEMFIFMFLMFRVLISKVNRRISGGPGATLCCIKFYPFMTGSQKTLNAWQSFDKPQFEMWVLLSEHSSLLLNLSVTIFQWG